VRLPSLLWGAFAPHSNDHDEYPKCWTRAGRRCNPHAAAFSLIKSSFTISVDAIFTNFLKRPFTSARGVIAAKFARDCLCRFEHAD
jgi:hypothetical protein